jgi:hypothetical protein
MNADGSHRVDVFVSTRLDIRPLWHWPASLKHLFESFDYLMLQEPVSPLASLLGRGFLQLAHAELLSVLMLASRATVAVDLYHRQTPHAPHLWDICKVRSAVQHRLCALEPPLCLTDASYDELVHDGVRLAALIYSDLVLFPLECTKTIKPRLAYDLRKTLEALFKKDEFDGQQERDVITWCVTMGALAAFETVHQDWYLSQLSKIMSVDERVLAWVSFQALMSHFLWWDYVLQPRLWDVWLECRKLAGPLGMDEDQPALPVRRSQ